jgi:hypothetical protein
MPYQFSNNAGSTLASGITAAATTMTVAAGEGSLFPVPSGANHFHATLAAANGDLEIVRVTARTNDNFTIVRAQEGTTAKIFGSGAVVQLRLTNAGLSNFPQLDAATNTFTGGVAANSFSGAGTNLTGTAASLSVGSAAVMTTPRTINGVSFNGSANITLTASTPNTATFNNGGTGAASGSTFNGSAPITVSYNTVGAPSTTGTNASGTWGISITGNAGTATNGVVTTGSYADPAWITSINYSKLTGTVPTWNQNTTGNAATVTNGVYTTGVQTIEGAKTFSADTTLRSAVPSLFFRSTINNSAMMLVDDGFFYLQRGGTDTTAATLVNGRNPLLINLATNDATFGAGLSAQSLVLGATNSLSRLTVQGTAGITAFTGLNRMGIAVGGSTSTNDLSGIDFLGVGGTEPKARIAIQSTGSGSRLMFGTSNNYASGITNTAMMIDELGQSFSVVPGFAPLYPEYRCRAWANFNGTGATSTNQAIRASGNITSIFKVGTGSYLANFATEMPDANYAVAGYCVYNTVASAGNVSFNFNYTMTTTQMSFVTANSNNGGPFDSAMVTMMFLR